MDIQTAIGCDARYTGRTSGLYHYAVIKSVKGDTAELTFTKKDKTVVSFHRPLSELIIFAKPERVVIGDTLYYWSNRPVCYHPARIEDIESDPVNGTVIRLHAMEFGKPVNFEKSMSGIRTPWVFDETHNEFINIKLP